VNYAASLLKKLDFETQNSFNRKLSNTRYCQFPRFDSLNFGFPKTINRSRLVPENWIS